MSILGIELKASDAVLCVLSSRMGLVEIPQIKQRKIAINDSDDQTQVKAFFNAIKQFVVDHKITKVVIKQRPQKGKFAGGAVGFKLESLIQLLDVEVEILASNTIKKVLKDSPCTVDMKAAGLKQFQEGAMFTAWAEQYK